MRSRRGGGHRRGPATTVSPIFLAAGDHADTIRAASRHIDLDAVLADSEVDLFKRLNDRPDAVCVVPLPLPTYHPRDFVERVTNRGSNVTVLGVGDAVDLPSAVITLPSSVTPERLAERVHQVIQERRLDEALERHDRLTTLLLRTLYTLRDGIDESGFADVIYDQFQASSLFEFIWVGRYRSEDNTLVGEWPLPMEIDVEAPSAIPGLAGTDVLSRAIETNSVTTTQSSSFTRSAAQSAPTSAGTTSTPESTLTVVPLASASRLHGVLVVSAERSTIDETGRTLLERFGRVAGDLLEAHDAQPRTNEAAVPHKNVLDVLIHELRNPLQVALQYLELARERDGPEDLDRVETALDRIATILSRGEALLPPASVQEREPLDLEVVAKSAWGAMDSGDATLIIDSPPDVYASRDHLHHLLGNLFRNAVEHGGPDVEVRLGTLPSDTGFYVEDSGPGISDDVREDLFEWGVTTDGDGLGIGLALVQEIARAHGWEIRATEAADGGARFEIITDESSSDAADDPGDLAGLFSEWEAKREASTSAE